MICTNIEQSKHLLELGLDPASADMWWSNRFVYWNSTPMICVATEQNQLYTFKWCEEDIPAWSLSALLEVMPNEYQPLLRKECKWYMDAWYEYGNLIAGGCYEPLDAAYEMVCKMLERGLIKKGRQDE